MRILCVTPTYWPAFQYGGPIESMHLLNKSILKNGIDLTVFTTFAGQIKAKKSAINEMIDGVNVKYFPYNNYLDLISTTGWHFSLEFLNALKNEIQLFDIVYIVSIWNFPTLAASYYCRKYNIPYVISPRGQLYEYVLRKKSWKKIPYYNLIAKRDISNANAIHYTTKHEKESTQKLLKFKNSSFIVPNGIDLNDYKEIIKENEFLKTYPFLKGKDILLFLGRLSWKKGLDSLLKSLPNVIKINKNIHLIVAGNDEDNYKYQLINILKELDINFNDLDSDNYISEKSYVTFTGHLDHKMKKYAFVDSKVFILNSYSENFGMSVIESMASGLPVVVSDNVGIADDIIENHAGVVINNKNDDIAKSICQLLSNKKLSDELIVNGKRLVQDKYDINKISKLFIKEMENIIYEH